MISQHFVGPNAGNGPFGDVAFMVRTLFSIASWRSAGTHHHVIATVAAVTATTIMKHGAVRAYFSTVGIPPIEVSSMAIVVVILQITLTAAEPSIIHIFGAVEDLVVGVAVAGRTR